MPREFSILKKINLFQFICKLLELSIPKTDILSIEVSALPIKFLLYILELCVYAQTMTL